ncbi:MAG: hypothetical protein ACT4OM_04950 [Actinomycetota bacterium]
MKKRILAALLVGGIVFAAAYALAAPLTVSSDNLGAGTDVVASCDLDGVDISYGLDVVDGEFVVDEVIVDGIDAACVGEDLQITLSDGLGAVLFSSGSIPVASPTTVPVAPAVGADEIEGVAVVITG